MRHYMFTQLSIFSILLLTQPKIALWYDTYNLQDPTANNSCKTEIDSLTKKLIYVTADILPTNEGGKTALMKKIERATITNVPVPENYDSNIIVAFIVDIDGTIKGERIIKDQTNKIGQQLLDIVKTFRWTPAKCDNKNVAMLYKLPIVIDPAEQ
jgi:hypothetical protein